MTNKYDDWLTEPIELGILPGKRTNDIGDIAYWQNIFELKKAPLICIQNKYVLSAAKLIYSGIDNLAWLTRESDKPDVKPNDFIQFTDKYLFPDSGIACNSKELYSARCGLLHCNTAESGFSRSGKARHIIYAAESSIEEKGYNHVRPEFQGKVVVVHINKLFHAYIRAINVLNKKIASEPDFADIIYQRSIKLYGLPIVK